MSSAPSADPALLRGRDGAVKMATGTCADAGTDAGTSLDIMVDVDVGVRALTIASGQLNSGPARCGLPAFALIMPPLCAFAFACAFACAFAFCALRRTDAYDNRLGGDSGSEDGRALRVCVARVACS